MLTGTEDSAKLAGCNPAHLSLNLVTTCVTSAGYTFIRRSVLSTMGRGGVWAVQVRSVTAAGRWDEERGRCTVS